MDLFADSLYDACETGDCAAAQRLIQHGAHVNQLIRGFTPLILACRGNSLDTIKFLLQANADVDQRGVLKLTALHCAAEYGNTEAVKLLCEYGAQVNITNNDGERALHLATKNNHCDCMKVLLDYGAEVNMHNIRDRTPLFYAKTVEAIQILLGAGANVNEKDKDHNTRLHEHAVEGRLDCLRILLENDADHTIANKKGKTALDVASKTTKPELERLIKELSHERCTKCQCRKCAKEHNQLTNSLQNQASELQTLSKNLVKQKRQNEGLENEMKRQSECLESKIKTLEIENKKLEGEVVQVREEVKCIPDRVSPDLPSSTGATTRDFLTDKMLYKIAEKIGDEQTKLGIYLDLEFFEIKRIQRDHHNATLDATMTILTTWRDRNIHLRNEERLRQLKEALQKIGRRDIIDCLRKTYKTSTSPSEVTC